MGPIDETKEVYTLDCYFRQYWYDERLVYNGTNLSDELAMNWQFLDKIWRPDTYFLVRIIVIFKISNLYLL